MSERVVLALQAPLERRLDASCIAADRFAALSESEIAALPVRYGGRAGVLSDFFAIQGERSARVRVSGNLERVDGIGTAMAGGELVVEGNAGRDIGMRLAGGTVDVRGDVGANAGGAPPGAARGMVGGEIIIRGSAGADAGAAMRRGIIAVTGNAGRGLGRGMIAGTALAFGKVATGAGRFLKRGSIVAFDEIDRPGTFRYACTYRPPHLRVLLRYLQSRYGLPIGNERVGGTYHRYSGDLAELGKGEILQWTGADK